MNAPSICATHMHPADASRSCDASMHVRTNELTHAEPPHLPDEKVEVEDAHARVAGGRLAYVKVCDGCGSDIFMAICRDGRWRPFEPKRQTVPLPFAWAWRKRVGMEETDRVCGHFIHYCADYHDRAFPAAVAALDPKGTPDA